jgi:hypothetical protein
MLSNLFEIELQNSQPVLGDFIRPIKQHSSTSFVFEQTLWWALQMNLKILAACK